MPDAASARYRRDRGYRSFGNSGAFANYPNCGRGAAYLAIGTPTTSGPRVGADSGGGYIEVRQSLAATNPVHSRSNKKSLNLKKPLELQPRSNIAAGCGRDLSVQIYVDLPCRILKEQMNMNANGELVINIVHGRSKTQESYQALPMYLFAKPKDRLGRFLKDRRYFEMFVFGCYLQAGIDSEVFQPRLVNIWSDLRLAK
ncbi:hypothetical protein EVAR_27884_1 [Eumeta japonica]|uniref:Uncharacterized protein n=1 Tax=Eumeta variegata TaxID=151549 RepID=A0A4C1UWA2_EUMVA|nr:hypothetical protein EVAR_27884_1 [Eumeta japonica]